MAICQECKQEMTEAQDCTAREAWSIAYDPPDPKWRCHDCNVRAGGKHHPGCDMERCPTCGGQLISCGCRND